MAMKNQVLYLTSVLLICSVSLLHGSPILEPVKEANSRAQAPPNFFPQISCGPTFMNITLLKSELIDLKVDLNNIHLQGTSCRGISISATTILIQSEVKEGVCGTRVRVNETHAIYENDVYLPPDPSLIIYRDDYIIRAACVYPRDMNVSLGLALHPIVSTKTITIVGKGEFEVKMALFKDPHYSIPRQQGDELTTKDFLYLSVFISKGDTERFHLVMKNCFSTPNQNYFNALKYYLIRRSCKNEYDSTIHVAANGIASYGQFSVQAFRFVGYSAIFFHCQVHLCDRQAGTCIPVCPAGDDGEGDGDFELGLGGIVIKDPATLCPELQCGASYINVTFQRRDLVDSGIDIPNLSLNVRNCHHLYDSGNRLTIGWPLGEGECGTSLTTNGTHATYSNAIYLAPNRSLIIYREEYFINVSCVYPLDLNVSLPNALIPFVNSTIITILGVGMFEVKMAAYRDPAYRDPYQTSPVYIATRTRLYVGVFISQGDVDQFNILLRNCYATPSANPHDATQYPLIWNSCPNEDDGSVQVEANGITSQGLFSFEMFKFTNFSTVFLHCQVHLCRRSTPCLPVCNGRTLRSAPEDGTVISLGPIHRQATPEIETPTVTSTVIPKITSQGIPEITSKGLPEITSKGIPEITSEVHSEVPVTANTTDPWDNEATYDPEIPFTETQNITATSKIVATTGAAGTGSRLEVLTVLTVLLCWMIH